MLCYQCGMTKNGKYCNDTQGACGKPAETARLQDELTGALIGLAKASANKSSGEEIQRLITEALAATAAHTDFDNAHLAELIERVKAAKSNFIPKFGGHNTLLKLPEDFDIRLIWQKSPEIRSLKSMLLFGIRGIALYVTESMALGIKNKEAAVFFHKALVALGANHFKEDYYTLLKEMGGIALRSMELTAKARNNSFGSPSPVEVPRIIEEGPFIIVSGHDYSVLEALLEQTKDTGISVYSHGETLPAHAFPKFRQYRHFKGHYGSGRGNQQFEFDNIPAAVVFTSGCITLPLTSYADRLFTAGSARISGIPHIERDFTPVMIRSIEAGGAPGRIEFPGINGGTVLKTGYGIKSVRTIAYKLAAAYSEGDLHHIYVIGGCDNENKGQSYYTDLVRRIPDDAVVITWGCAKFRFNDIAYGEIGGISRIIDLGMCSDLPAVIELVEAIASSAKVRTEDLPLHWHYSWQEQRSTAQLFALLSADIRDITLGPVLPPYFTQETFRNFASEYGIHLLADSFNTAEEPVPEEITAETVPEEEESVIPAEETIPEESAVSLLEEEQPGFSGEEETLPDTQQEIDIEERSEAAGLPDWAVMDETEDGDYTEEETAAETAEKIRPEDINQMPDWADEDSAEEEAGETETPITAENPQKTIKEDSAPIQKETSPFPEEPPKPVLPKGKGVSGWKDPDEEPAFVPGEKKTYHYSPPRELVEITPPPAVSLPPGAGISGFAADRSSDAYSERGNDSDTLYSFAEPLPEIVIPKGKGVSGWKEEDDEFRPAKKTDTENNEKPWLKKSLEKLHSEVESDSKPAEAIPSAIEVKKAGQTEEQKQPAAKEQPAEPEFQDKPWLAASLKQLKESIAEDEQAEASSKNSKPWLEASLRELHASVEADAEEAAAAPPTPSNANTEKDEEVYTSSYRHDEKSAAEKPWLKTSIEELKDSIDRDSGIKTIRKAEKAPGEEKSAEEAARWQNASPAKSWKDITPASTPQSTEVTVETTPASVPDSVDTEPSGGAEPSEKWQKPKVLPKPWDEDLQTVWKKPDVIPKPWEMPQQNPFGVPAQGNTTVQPYSPEAEQQADNYTPQPSYEEQQAQYSAQQEQLAILQAQYAAQQQAQYEATQQALAEQQAAAEYRERAALEAEQRAYAAEQHMAMEIDRMSRERAAQEEYSARLQFRAEQLAAAKAQQEAESQQLRARTEQLRQLQQQQQYQLNRQSMQERRERAAYTAQLKQEEEQLRMAQQQQAAERARLEQEAAQINAARASLQKQSSYLAQQEQQIQQAAQQTVNPYTFAQGNNSRDDMVLSPGAGVSGFGGSTFIPGQERPVPNLNATVLGNNQNRSGMMPEFQSGTGVSGSRYHEELPPISTDYTQTCYGVPQKTPQINLPQGAGISGWTTPEPPVPQQAPRQNFFGFMNSDAPAGVRSNSEVITPGSGDEYIATKGPDGEVTLTIRTDKK